MPAITNNHAVNFHSSGWIEFCAIRSLSCCCLQIFPGARQPISRGYRGIQPPKPMRAVSLENQFGKFKIRTGTGYGLLVPTHNGNLEAQRRKRSATSSLPTRGSADDSEASVSLSDQFGASEVKTDGAPLFCRPGAAKSCWEGLSHSERARPPAHSEHLT